MALGGIQEGIQGSSACLPGASQARQLARDESTGDTEGNTASGTGFDPADDASASGDIRYIDIYDPSTWPVDPNDSVDLGDVVPIDLYDPSTWPIEISTDDEPVDVEQIDLYDPDTWPSAEKSEAESASSAGGRSTSMTLLRGPRQLARLPQATRLFRVPMTQPPGPKSRVLL